MKVIFLDIDGVLNSTKTYVANGGYPFELTEMESFDTHAIKILRRLCNSAGISVVMSTSWRSLFAVEDFKHHLDLPVIDKTPHLWNGITGTVPRGREIEAWLNEHPEVTHYVIIDDNSDMLENQMDNFVQTDGNEGYSWKNHQDVCRILDANPFEGSADTTWRKDRPTQTKGYAG